MLSTVRDVGKRLKGGLTAKGGAAQKELVKVKSEVWSGKEGSGCGSVGRVLASMHKVLGSVPSAA